VVDRRRPAEVERLIEDLRGGQVAPELHLAGGAERAGQRAARLGGEADRAAPVAIAHQYGLDGPRVVRAEQVLDGAVRRVRLTLDGEGRERDVVAQGPAHGERQVRHVLESAGAPRRPSPHLIGAVAGLPEILKLRCQ